MRATSDKIEKKKTCIQLGFIFIYAFFNCHSHLKYGYAIKNVVKEFRIISIYRFDLSFAPFFKNTVGFYALCQFHWQKMLMVNPKSISFESKILYLHIEWHFESGHEICIRLWISFVHFLRPSVRFFNNFSLLFHDHVPWIDDNQDAWHEKWNVSVSPVHKSQVSCGF